MVGAGVPDADLERTRSRLQRARQEAHEVLRRAQSDLDEARVRLERVRSDLDLLRQTQRTTFEEMRSCVRALEGGPGDARRDRVDAPDAQAIQRAHAEVEADFVRRFRQQSGDPFRA